MKIDLEKKQEKQEKPDVVTVGAGANRLSVGQTTMRKIAQDANAVVKIGRCYRIRWDRVEKYLGLSE